MSGLSRNPQIISPHIWYYEEPSGIVIVYEIYDFDKYERTEKFKIPWGKLKKSLDRKLEDKSKAKKMKT